MDVPRLLRPLSRVPRWAIFGFALTGLLLQAFGLYWDTWCHFVVGRESFFTPPHLVLYAGFAYVALAGIVGSVSGAIAPRWAGPRVRIVGLLVPVEFLLIGTGALFQAVAFPWDETWHRLVAEGLVSETFWSPPHVMAIAGGIVSTFGFFLAVVLERRRSTPACDRSWSSARSPCLRQSCSWRRWSIWRSSSSALGNSDSSPRRSRVARGRSCSTSSTWSSADSPWMPCSWPCSPSRFSSRAP